MRHHADIMSVKNTCFSLLSSSTVHEIMEMIAIAHMSTVEHQTPLLTPSKALSANIEVIRNAHMCSIMHVILFKYFVIFHTFYINTNFIKAV